MCALTSEIRYKAGGSGAGAEDLIFLALSIAGIQGRRAGGGVIIVVGRRCQSDHSDMTRASLQSWDGACRLFTDLEDMADMVCTKREAPGGEGGFNLL